jgi:hypothetical protein
MTRPQCFVLGALLTLFGIVGNLDYADALRVEAIKKEQRPRLARQSEPAPLYSRRCAGRGLDFIAHQKDGGQWVIHCVPRAVAT